MFGFKSLTHLGNYVLGVEAEEQESKEVKAIIDEGIDNHSSLPHLEVFKLSIGKENEELVAFRTKKSKEIPAVVSEFSSDQLGRTRSSQPRLTTTNNIHEQKNSSYGSYNTAGRPGIDCSRATSSGLAVPGESSNRSLRVFSNPTHNNLTQTKSFSPNSQGSEYTIATGAVYTLKKVPRSSTNSTYSVRRSPSHSHNKSLTFPQKRLDRTSPLVSQADSKARRLSPLRESTGNFSQRTVLQESVIVARKRRRSSSQILDTPKAFNSIHQSTEGNFSLKSFLSAKSSFAENLTYGNNFLGRHRTPSTPEFWYSPATKVNSTVRLTPRSVSLGSLKHLPPDRQSNLYIGVSNPKLFISSKTRRCSALVAVTYRYPCCKRRKMASMTPKAIVGPGGACDKLNESVSPDIPCLNVQQSTSSGSGNELRSIDPAFSRRNSSTAATDGSVDSIGDCSRDLSTVVSRRDGFPAQNPMNLELGDDQIMYYPPIRSVGACRFTVQNYLNTENHGDENPTVDQSNNLNFRMKKCNQLDCDCVLGPDENYSCWHPPALKNRLELNDADMLESVEPEDVTESKSDNEPELKAVLETWLKAEAKNEIKPNDHSEAKVCRTSSLASPRTATRRSVSFAEGTVDKPAIPWSSRNRFAFQSDLERPSPLIPARLRGPSFSREFEENMLTLPMPPAEHVYAGGRRPSYSTFSSTTAGGSGNRTVSVLSKKPEGFRAKVKYHFKGLFIGCMSACQPDEWE